MTSLYKDLKSALTNVENIVERCNFKFPDFKYHLPKFTNPSSKSDTQYFNDLCHDGLKDYLDSSTFDNKIYEERLVYVVSLNNLYYPLNNTWGI